MVGLHALRLFLIKNAAGAFLEVFQLALAMSPVEGKGRPDKKEGGKPKDNNDVGSPGHGE